MSDQEAGSGPGADRFDAVERLRRRWDAAKTGESGTGSAADGASNVVRLPRRPRRGREDIGDPRHRPWPSEAVYDPAPTRPVTRAELQSETGTWPIDAVPPAGADTEHERNVIDLGASRRKRAGADGAPGGARPMVRPRRIGPGEHAPGGDAAPPDRSGR
ncbi:hypothetical protein ACFXK0_12855 [Nocardia sp. NPDC059177]|uniref:hypothetical protein n=1 Tax=Nocardia sp. NPDC059177 TaxID=3346759 RepID=UPI003678E589